MNKNFRDQQRQESIQLFLGGFSVDLPYLYSSLLPSSTSCVGSGEGRWWVRKGGSKKKALLIVDVKKRWFLLFFFFFFLFFSYFFFFLFFWPTVSHFMWQIHISSGFVPFPIFPDEKKNFLLKNLIFDPLLFPLPLPTRHFLLVLYFKLTAQMRVILLGDSPFVVLLLQNIFYFILLVIGLYFYFKIY